jgi:hypothetical protein
MRSRATTLLLLFLALTAACETEEATSLSAEAAPSIVGQWRTIPDGAPISDLDFSDFLIGTFVWTETANSGSFYCEYTAEVTSGDGWSGEFDIINGYPMRPCEGVPPPLHYTFAIDENDRLNLCVVGQGGAPISQPTCHTYRRIE